MEKDQKVDSSIQMNLKTSESSMLRAFREMEDNMRKTFAEKIEFCE